MSRRLSARVAAGLALGVLAGCGTALPGSFTQSGVVPAQPAAPTLPPRPRVIPVVGVDACSIVPTEVLAQVGLPPTGKLESPDPRDPRLSDCEWKTDFADAGTPNLTLGVVTADQDTAALLRFPDAKQTSVAGFGAVDGVEGLVRLGSQQACLLRIDVAPGQGLWVDYDNPLGDLPGVNHDLLCRRATTVAEAIIDRLSSKQN